MNLHLTVDETVELLKRSSLCTVVVEGKDDMTIYRWIEQKIGINKVNILPCGGRDKLLQVYDRRDQFGHIKTIFLADKDSFVYSSVPQEYNEIIWTKGYSIENDLYAGKFLEKLLNINEEVNFRISLKYFILYYAFEVEQFNKKQFYNFSTHPNLVLNDSHELNNEYLSKVNFSTPSAETINYLEKEYDLLIRGKSLFALLLRFLSSHNREVKHSKKSLCETSFKLGPNDYLKDIMNQIEKRL